MAPFSVHCLLVSSTLWEIAAAASSKCIVSAASKCQSRIVNSCYEGLNAASEHVIMGDFNCSRAATKNVVRARGRGCHVLDFGPTCFAGKSSSSIDYAIVSSGLLHKVMDTWSEDSILATHRPIFLQLKIAEKEPLVDTIAKDRSSAAQVFGPKLILGEGGGIIK